MKEERLKKRDWIVKPISQDTAVAFIERYHYAKGASLTSVYTLGLFRKDADFFECQALGVSFWLPPTKNTALSVFGDWTKVLTLSRLAVAPEVPANACSFLLARSRRLIKENGRFKCLVTFADTSQEHTGAIYRADNWEYLGMTKPTPVWVNADGKTMGAKRAGRNLTKAEMQKEGFCLKGYFPKHKFRFVL